MNNVINESVILKVKYPVITSYTSDAHMLSILSSYPSTEAWVFNNYINLWGEEPCYENGFSILRFHSWSIKKVCPYFKINHFKKSFFDSNITEFIISKIDMGKYIDVVYDQYYIPNTIQYKDKHSIHDMLIYGYDRKQRLFFVADFFKYSKYEFETVPFDCVETAIINALESCVFGCDEIEFIHTNYKFSNYFLINSLNNYLHSQNIVAENENVIINEFELDQIEKGRYTFGIKNYSLLKQKLLKVLLNETAFHVLKALHVIFDHKVMMCERLNYLANMGTIDYNDPIIDEYSNIKNISLLTRNLFIKFAHTKDNRLLDKIINNINIIESLEVEALNYLVKNISTKP